MNDDIPDGNGNARDASDAFLDGAADPCDAAPLSGISRADTPTAPAPVPLSPRGRLVSLDALRGFDMFWIIGGGVFMVALYRWIPGCPFLKWWASQAEHAQWHGFTLEDLIFPLFIFISGAAMPFSLVARLERGDSRVRLYARIARRCVLLILLGCIYNGLLDFRWGTMRYASVLGRIGLAGFLAALIVMHMNVRLQIAAIAVILLGYWAALALIPVPGVEGAGKFTMEGSLAGYIDRQLLPGALYLEVHDPEGILSTIPAVATALLGAVAGALLRAAAPRPMSKVLVLAAAGAASVGVAYLWDAKFPINKNLWTSSFVLYAGGWSLMLLGLFHLLFDMLRLRALAFVFVVIGLNSLTIYVVAHRLIDFEHTARFLFGGAAMYAGSQAGPVVVAVGVLFLEWLFLLCLYRGKLFLRL